MPLTRRTFLDPHDVTPDDLGGKAQRPQDRGKLQRVPVPRPQLAEMRDAGALEAEIEDLDFHGGAGPSRNRLGHGNPPRPPPIVKSSHVSPPEDSGPACSVNRGWCSENREGNVSEIVSAVNG